MEKLSIMFIALCLISGCATVEYRNSNPARNNQASLDQDFSYCEAVAAGSIPMPSVQQYQNNVSMYTPGSGTMRDQYGNVYTYHENYNPMAAAQSNLAMAQQNFNNAAVGLQNLGAQLETQEARNNIFGLCMQQRGWESRIRQ